MWVWSKDRLPLTDGTGSKVLLDSQQVRMCP